MSFQDLLALTEDDLMAMTNRGTVKRAKRELESEQLGFEFEQNAGELICKWSDGIVCTFAEGKTVHDAHCSSESLGISRHVIRSVLAYQSTHASQSTQESSPDSTDSAKAVSHSRDWDPGTITDQDLESAFGKNALRRARKQFDQGILVELSRGIKPVARFLHESCAVRFPVPDDPRYATADCAESKMPLWVIMAVWAFRELAADRLSGLVSLQSTAMPVPANEIGKLKKLIAQLASDGFAGSKAAWAQKLARIGTGLQQSGLVWPANLIEELVQQHDYYQQQNALFDSIAVARLIGELVARIRAITNPDSEVPQALVRGTSSDRTTEVGSSRYVGVGMGIEPGRKSVSLNAYLQDVDSGNVAAITRTFNNPDEDDDNSPKTFSELSETTVKRGITLRRISESQVILGQGKRTAGNQIVLPRGEGNLSANPHQLEWEQLKPPFAVESFEQLRQRLSVLPPSWLRARRCTEDLAVIAISKINNARFHTTDQQLEAELLDGQGEVAEMVHPYHSRSKDAFNELIEITSQEGSQVRFVCGRVRLFGKTIRIYPVSFVFDNPSGRKLVQTWIANNESVTSESSEAQQEEYSDPIIDFQSQLNHSLGECLIMGLVRVSDFELKELVSKSRLLGFNQITESIQRLVDELEKRKNSRRWMAEDASRHLAQLCVMALAMT